MAKIFTINKFAIEIAEETERLKRNYGISLVEALEMAISLYEDYVIKGEDNDV